MLVANTQSPSPLLTDKQKNINLAIKIWLTWKILDAFVPACVIPFALSMKSLKRPDRTGLDFLVEKSLHPHVTRRLFSVERKRKINQKDKKKKKREFSTVFHARLDNTTR